MTSQFCLHTVLTGVRHAAGVGCSRSPNGVTECRRDHSLATGRTRLRNARRGNSVGKFHRLWVERHHTQFVRFKTIDCESQAIYVSYPNDSNSAVIARTKLISYQLRRPRAEILSRDVDSVSLGYHGLKVRSICAEPISNCNNENGRANTHCDDWHDNCYRETSALHILTHHDRSI